MNSENLYPTDQLNYCLWFPVSWAMHCGLLAMHCDLLNHLYCYGQIYGEHSHLYSLEMLMVNRNI